MKMICQQYRRRFHNLKRVLILINCIRENLIYSIFHTYETETWALSNNLGFVIITILQTDGYYNS